MHQVSFGSVLKEARIARGLDRAQVSRELRIRQDIIASIETSDFERMPPRGYVRNMVAAYARLVGLNPQEISRMYLDQEYAYQVEAAHRSVDFSVQMHREIPGSSRNRSVEQARSRRRSSQNMPLYDSQSAHQARRAAISAGKYTNLYSAPRRAPKRSIPRLPIIIVGVVVLVIVIVVAVVVLTGQQSAQSNIPVTGATSAASGVFIVPLAQRVLNAFRNRGILDANKAQRRR